MRSVRGGLIPVLRDRHRHRGSRSPLVRRRIMAFEVEVVMMVALRPHLGRDHIGIRRHAVAIAKDGFEFGCHGLSERAVSATFLASQLSSHRGALFEP